MIYGFLEFHLVQLINLNIFDVSVYVDDNCNAQHGQEQHRLEPRGCGKRQDQENDNDRKHQHTGNLGIDSRAGVLPPRWAAARRSWRGNP